ncbi:MAG: hypothetical protein AB7P99_21935 [Vicinamibacterales bacterium]
MTHELALKLRSYERALARDLRAQHRHFRQSLPRYLRDTEVRNLVTAPVVYSLGLPLVLLDLWVTLYQWVCFPLYGITRVRRRDYFVIDRHRLAYLNGIEKANCVYCGYANGLLAYVHEIAGRTEQFWCPIRHRRRLRHPHAHYRAFVDYEDAAGYRRELPRLRRSLRP